MRALIISVDLGDPDFTAHAEEFAMLAKGAGAEIVGTLTARRDRPDAKFFIGSGKADEGVGMAQALLADIVLFDQPLSPAQQRNLERVFNLRVVDRVALILDIFALRAKSHEGKLQVELAQLKHIATRLVRGWTHLERQRGGSIGLRGPGETQLETDRRLLQKRVDQLQKRLEKVEVQHTQMRRARVRSELPRVALVGYTNAGKSTLFNALTGAEAYAADQLFATLDPTVRRVNLAGGAVVLADTVGFVRDLPHELVAAFRSTLSEAREADLLLHVVDAADPLREERMAQVDLVLNEIGAGDIPQLLVFNKIDRIEGAQPRHDAPEGAPDETTEPGTLGLARERVWISARDGVGLDLLQDALAQRLGLERIRGEVLLPSSAGRLRARLFDLEAVRGEAHEEAGWRLTLDMARSDAQKLLSQPGGEALRPLLPAVEVEQWEA
ncbi:TPA: GTPase HflX [Pseudomonas aeruginosa]|nr:GTPase HflX [Pseudomonas aeruginosa]